MLGLLVLAWRRTADRADHRRGVGAAGSCSATRVIIPSVNGGRDVLPGRSSPGSATAPARSPTTSCATRAASRSVPPRPRAARLLPAAARPVRLPAPWRPARAAHRPARSCSINVISGVPLHPRHPLPLLVARHRRRCIWRPSRRCAALGRSQAGRPAVPGRRWWSRPPWPPTSPGRRRRSAEVPHGYLGRPGPAARRSRDRAASRAAGNAGVTAIYYLVPHLTHRVLIYEWPNPCDRPPTGASTASTPDDRVSSTTSWSTTDLWTSLRHLRPVDRARRRVHQGVWSSDVVVAKRVRPPG